MNIGSDTAVISRRVAPLSADSAGGIAVQRVALRQRRISLLWRGWVFGSSVDAHACNANSETGSASH